MPCAYEKTILIYLMLDFHILPMNVVRAAGEMLVVIWGHHLQEEEEEKEEEED